MSTKQVKALNITDINISEINISTKKTNNKVPITLRNKSLIFQTPYLEVTGQLRKTPYPNIYQLDTLFKGESNKKIQQWYQFLENLETHITSQIVNYGSKWFTKKNAIIKSLIRESEQKGSYFVKWVIDFQTNIFIDENKNEFDPNNLKERDLVKMIVKISDLWVQENQCGLAVFVQKVMVKPFVEQIPDEYVFGSDEESEDNSDDFDDKEDNIISLLATEQKPKINNKLVVNANSLKKTVTMAHPLTQQDSNTSNSNVIEESESNNNVCTNHIVNASNTANVPNTLNTCVNEGAFSHNSEKALDRDRSRKRYHRGSDKPVSIASELNMKHNPRLKRKENESKPNSVQRLLNQDSPLSSENYEDFNEDEELDF